jgi:hypothetical protein
MGIEKTCENEILALVKTATTGMNTVSQFQNDVPVPMTVYYRASHSDNDTEPDIEERQYPYVKLETPPYDTEGFAFTFGSVNVSVEIATHFDDDRKRQNLWAIYEAVRRTIANSATKANYWIKNGKLEMDGKKQALSFDIVMRVCAAYT